jgi:hypothetical protein
VTARRLLAALLCVLALGAFIACALGDAKLAPCPKPSVRRWIFATVNVQTQVRAAQGLPPLCSTPVSVTKCTDANAHGGFVEILIAAKDWIAANYSGPGGWPLYATLPNGNAVWVKCPTTITVNGQTYSEEYVQPGNPVPSNPVVDLDALHPATPGLKRPPNPLTIPGGGGAGGSTIGGDCALCLAQAACDGLTMAECETQHCAAVCPVGGGGGAPMCGGDELGGVGGYVNLGACPPSGMGGPSGVPCNGNADCASCVCSAGTCQ